MMGVWKQIAPEDIAEARELYEAGELAITEVAKRIGTHYMRLLSIADKGGWCRKSSLPEINRARRIASNGLHRRALDYLCGLVPTGQPNKDEEIIIETRRINTQLKMRASAALSAAQASESSRPARSSRAT